MTLLLSLLACGTGEILDYPDAATYDQACTAPADCAVVVTDDCSCSCDRTALSTTGAAAFQNDVEAYWDASATGCQLGCDPQCDELTATCTDGACVIDRDDSG